MNKQSFVRVGTPAIHRALSGILAFVLAISLMPSIAWAQADDQSQEDSLSQLSQSEDYTGTTGSINSSETTPDSSTLESTNSASGASSATNSGDSATTTSASSQASVSTTSESSQSVKSSASTESTANTLATTEASSAEDPVVSKASTSVTATLIIKVNDQTIRVSYNLTSDNTVEDLIDRAVEDNSNRISAYTHGDAYPGYPGYYVSSITLDDVRYGPTADYSSYWSSYTNGALDYSGINVTSLTDGLVYELVYVSNDNKSAASEYHPDVETPDIATSDDTTAFHSTTQGNISSNTQTPTTTENSELAFQIAAGPLYDSDIIPYLSDALIINGNIYLVHGIDSGEAILSVYNPLTGAEIKAVTLKGSISWTCRPVYSNGMILIPLTNGQFQAVSADTLETVWVSQALDEDSQGVATPYLYETYAERSFLVSGTYYATYDGWSVASSRGLLFCLDVLTGTTQWIVDSATEDSQGYYWSGGASVNGTLVWGGESGTLYALNKETGNVLSSLHISDAELRSTITTDETGLIGFVTSKDGYLYKFTTTNGAVELLAKTRFSINGTSPSSATHYDGKLYVGGCDENYQGTLSIIDAETLAIETTISVPATVLSTPVLSTPTVVNTSDGTYVYFTTNSKPGGVYAYRVGDESATLLYEPEDEASQYCMKSVVIGADGTLYWTNDSGYLFALTKNVSSSSTSSSETSTPQSSTAASGETFSSASSKPSTTATSSTTGTTGRVAASMLPLSQEDTLTATSADNDNTVLADQDDELSSANTTTDTSTPTTSFNWLPLIGIVVGLILLLGLLWFLLAKRNRNTTDEA